MKKLNQFGLLHLHVVLPIVIAIAAIGGIGTYVISKSKASPQVTVNQPCPKPSGQLNNDTYKSAVGSATIFKQSIDSNSVRNIAVQLCYKGFLSGQSATNILTSGNYQNDLLVAYKNFQKNIGYKGKSVDGIPDKNSLQKLGLNPIGF